MKVRVLVVEDEKMISLPLARLLRAEGWSVVVAGTAAAALAEVEKNNFDAALIDLGLPDQSGHEVLSLIHI